MTASLAVVIVTHDSARVLGRCLDALYARTDSLRPAVVVADSGSCDATADVAARYPVTFLAGANRGFGAAVNRALRHPSVNGARWLLVLNPDAHIATGRLDRVCQALDRHPRCAIAGARLVDAGGRFVPSMGVLPTAAAWWRAAREGWGDWVWEAQRYSDGALCDWVAGCFMLARREVLVALGGFDERFFLYSEEVDLCARARLAGWDVRLAPEVVVCHDRAFTPERDLYRARMLSWSKVLYTRKWDPPYRWPLTRLALLAAIARRARDRRREGGPWAAERAELMAAAWFRSRRYGPARASRSQEHDALLDAADRAPGAEPDQLGPPASQFGRAA